MADSFRIHLFVLLLSLTLTWSLSLESKGSVFPPFIRWHVFVVNGLNGNERLFAHCRSQDDDLGLQSLPPAANFSWSFKANFFHSTLFWCHLRRDGGSGSAFKVFWHDPRLFERCGWKNCVWIARDDAIYIRDFTSGIDQFYYLWKF